MMITIFNINLLIKDSFLKMRKNNKVCLRGKHGKGVLDTAIKAYAAYKGAKFLKNTTAKIGNKVKNMGSKVKKTFNDLTGITAKNRSKKLANDAKVGKEMVEYIDKVREKPKQSPNIIQSDVDPKRLPPKITQSTKIPETLMDKAKAKIGIPTVHSIGTNPVQSDKDVFYDAEGIKREPHYRLRHMNIFLR
jgi:hypothetical protein